MNLPRFGRAKVVAAALLSAGVACTSSTASKSPARPVAPAFDPVAFSAKLYQGVVPPPVLAGIGWLPPAEGTVDNATLRKHADRIVQLLAILPSQISSGQLDGATIRELAAILPAFVAAEKNIEAASCDEECLDVLNTFYTAADQQALRQGGFVRLVQSMLGLASGGNSSNDDNQLSALYRDVIAAIERAAPRHRYTAARLITTTHDRARLVRILNGINYPLRDAEEFELAAVAANEVVRDIEPSKLERSDIITLGGSCYDALQLVCGDWALAQTSLTLHPTWDELDANAARNALQEKRDAAKRVLDAQNAADVESVLATAKGEMVLGRIKAARTRLQKLGEAHPNEARAWSRLAEWEANFGDGDPAKIAALLDKAQHGVGQDANHYGFMFMQFYQNNINTVLRPYMQDPAHSIALVKGAIRDLRVILEGWAKLEPRGTMFLRTINALEPHLMTIGAEGDTLVPELFALVKELYGKYPTDIDVTIGAGFAARFELGTAWSTKFLAEQATLHAGEAGLRLDLQTSTTLITAALLERNAAAVTAVLQRLATLRRSATELAMRKERAMIDELLLLVQVAQARMATPKTGVAPALWGTVRDSYKKAASEESDAEVEAHLWNNAAVALWAAGDRKGALEAWAQIKLKGDETDAKMAVRYNIAVAANDQAALAKLAATELSSDFNWAVARAAARRLNRGPSKTPVPAALAGAQRPGATTRNLDGDLGVLSENAFQIGLGYSTRQGLNAPLTLSMTGWLLIDAAETQN
jgi:hypothetical protein